MPNDTFLTPEGRAIGSPSDKILAPKATILQRRSSAAAPGRSTWSSATHFRVSGMFAGNAAHDISRTTVAPPVLSPAAHVHLRAATGQGSDLMLPPAALFRRDSGAPTPLSTGENPLQPPTIRTRTTAAHFETTRERRHIKAADENVPFTPDLEFAALQQAKATPPANALLSVDHSSATLLEDRRNSAGANEPTVVVSFGADGKPAAGKSRRLSSLRKSSGERTLLARRSRSFGGIDEADALRNEVSDDLGGVESGGAHLTNRNERSTSGAGSDTPPRSFRRGTITSSNVSPSGRRLSLPTPAAATILTTSHAQPTFRRMSYASPEAQGAVAVTAARLSAAQSHTTPPRRSSAKGAPTIELTPFEEFSSALQAVVQHPAAEAVTNSAKRRQSLAVDHRPDMALFSPGMEIQSSKHRNLSSPSKDGPTTNGRSPVHRRSSIPNGSGDMTPSARDEALVLPMIFPQRSSHSVAIDEGGDDDPSGGMFDKRAGRRRSAQFRSLLISADDSSSVHHSGGGSDVGETSETNISGSRSGLSARQTAHRGGPPTASSLNEVSNHEETTGGSASYNPHDGITNKVNDERSEVEAHLYRASMAPIPLAFVVSEVHDRIHRDRMLLDLIYFIPFIVIFSLYFVSRDITTNFYSVASLSSTNLNVDPSAHQVDVLNEYFRIDTQLNNGNEALYMKDDGTDILNAIYGPQILRLVPEIKIPPIVSILDVTSKTAAFRWLLHVLAANLWDSNNPNTRYEDKTVIGGNLVLLGGLRLRSMRMKEGCSAINDVIWHASGAITDVSCYDDYDPTALFVDAYCNVSNPAVAPSTVVSRLEQVTPVAMDASLQQLVASVSSESSSASSASLSSYGSSILSSSSTSQLVSTFTETLFSFYDCPSTSTTGASEMGQVNLRHSCSGHVMTLPFQASHHQVQEAIRILAPPAAEPSIWMSGDDAMDAVLHDLLESWNSRVPSNHCSAFLFHHSVRVFYAEYFSYAIDSDSFFRTRMMIEMTASGAAVPSHSVRMFRVWTTNSIYQLSLQGLVLLFVVRFALRTLSDWKTSKDLSGSYLTFLKDPWNVMDVTNNVTLIASAILTALWWSASIGIRINFNRDPRYPNQLEHVEELFSMQVYCNAVNVVLVFLKVLKFLRINDRLSVMTKTLAECQQDIVALMILFLFLHTGFSIAATAVYGSSVYVFRSVDSSFINLLLALILGVDYDTMRKVDPTFTGAFFWSFIVLELFLLLNFFIAILGEGFAQVNQSMHLPSLDLALLRVVDEIRMVLRWSYLKEFLFASSSRSKSSKAGLSRLVRGLGIGITDEPLDHIQSLVLMHACLKEHLRLSLQAVEDVRRSNAQREHVPMYFRDMAWWLPKDVYSSLGGQYLLVLWEDILYTYNIKERLNVRSGERSDFGRAVEVGIAQVMVGLPDVLSMEVQAEVVLDKLDKLPLKLANWSAAKEAIKRAATDPNTTVAERGSRRGSFARRPSSGNAPAAPNQERRRSSVQPNKPRSVKRPEDALLAELARPTFVE